jgi:hypothetical protein
MKKVVIDFTDWNCFEDEQVEEIKKVCADSVECMVGLLFNGAMATIDLDGDELFLNIHDEDMENDLGRVSIDDIFDSYTDSDKLQTPESLKRAVTLRDKLEEMQKAIDKAVKGAKRP